MRSIALSRRTMLRGAGGFAVALPFLEIMQPRKARAAVVPKYFVYLFNTNGYVHSTWLPKKTGPRESDFSLAGTTLQPIADAGLQGDVVILNGVENKALRASPGAGHPKGTGIALTCRPLSEGNFVGGGGQAAGYASGISMDQILRRTIDTGPGRNSLEIGVVARRRDAAGQVAYTDTGTPLPPQGDPRLVFMRLFANQVSDPASLARYKATKTSVLDFAQADCARVKSMLGAADREKFDKYCQQLIETETAVKSLLPTQCTKPDLGTVADPNRIENAPATYNLQVQLMVLAMKCDLVRVSTLMFGFGGGAGSGSGAGMAYPWLGFSQGHHGMSHSSPLLPASATPLSAINKWWTQALFVPLVQRLKTETGVDGKPLLDNTLVMWTNELGNADLHRADHLPYVLAGKLGGRLATGRFIDLLSPPSTNSLMLSVANAYGAALTTFGDPRFCPGPLAGVFS